MPLTVCKHALTCGHMLVHSMHVWTAYKWSLLHELLNSYCVTIEWWTILRNIVNVLAEPSCKSLLHILNACTCTVSICCSSVSSFCADLDCMAVDRKLNHLTKKKHCKCMFDIIKRWRWHKLATESLWSTCIRHLNRCLQYAVLVIPDWVSAWDLHLTAAVA